MFLRSGDARMHRIVRLKIVRFLPTRDSPSLTRTLPTSSCPYVARIPTLFPILFPDIDIFSSLSLSRENCHLIAACQTNLYLNLATYNFLLTNQESHRKRNLDPISAIIRNTWTKKKTLDSLSLSRLFLFLSLPFPKHSGKSEEKDIEKESNAFSRRAWRIPNSDWQLINTASRHSRGQLARPRYRNAIFIARVCARAPTHTHTYSPSIHTRLPHRNCQLYRGNRSPQSPAISSVATSLLMLPPSLPLTSSISVVSVEQRSNSTTSCTIVIAISPVLNLSTRVLSWEECRTRHLFSASVNAANYRRNRKSSFPPPI